MTTSQGVMERALAAALKHAKPKPEDGAAVALARRLAQVIDVLRGEEDEPVRLVRLASEYEKLLTALGMTVAGRNARAGIVIDTAHKEQPKPAKSPLQAQRDEIATRRAQKAAGP